MFVMFAPVFVIFFMKTVALFPSRPHLAVTMMGKSVPTVDDQVGMMGGAGTGNMWRTEISAAPTIPAMPMMNFVSVGTDRKVTKSASLELRAESLEWTSGQIQEVVKRVGGYVESTNLSQPMRGVKTAWLSVRVPADRLEATMEDTKKVASVVVSENMNAGDVTDQGIDLAARLNARQAEEEALVSLLNKAAKVSDVIEVTDRLSLVRSEIERMKAEQRMLEGQVSMASISISITEDPRIVVDTNPVRGGNVVKQSVTDIARWGIAFGSALVELAIGGLPVVIMYGFVIWVAYRFGRFVANKVVSKKK